MQHNGWDHALKVTADGKGLVGHAGAILLRKAADQAGLTAALSAALRKKGTSPLLDRGIVLVSMAAAIALGATSMSDIALLAHLAPVLGDAPSGPTVRRALDLAGTPAMLDRIARARARARAHAWTLIEGTPAGFPWLDIAGKTLAGWVVIDMDATLVTAHSRQGGGGSHLEERLRLPSAGGLVPRTPASAWPCCCAPATPARTPSPTTRRCWPPRSGRSPPGSGARSWSASTGPAPATTSSSTCCPCPPRAGPLLFTCGWMITAADEDAIRMVPAGAWKPGIAQDGSRRGGQGRRGDHAPDEPRRELARRPAVDRPPGQAVPPPDEEPDRLREEDRLAVLHHLHEHPGQRDRRRPGQPPPPVHRRGPPRARLRRDRRASAPPRPWACAACRRRPGRSTAAGSSPRTSPPTWPPGPASSATATTPELRDADPDTLRYRVWHLPARLARHARQRTLAISPDWPWAEAFLTCWQRLCALPAPA